ncbi:MAG: hypothetical protein QXJ53_04125 [Candidatus Bathyarchaeia archaeon]
MKNKILLSTALAVAFFLVSMTSVMAWTSMTYIDPWASGNAEFEASQIGSYMYAYKFDDWDEYTYPYTFVVTHEGNTITVTSNDGRTFNWSATSPISAVIVKAGTGANVFFYDPAALSDNGLYAPLGPKGGPRDISHVTFCWNAPTEVIPEVPVGTIVAMVSMVAAFGVYFGVRKRKALPF